VLGDADFVCRRSIPIAHRLYIPRIWPQPPSSFHALFAFGLLLFFRLLAYVLYITLRAAPRMCGVFAWLRQRPTRITKVRLPSYQIPTVDRYAWTHRRHKFRMHTYRARSEVPPVSRTILIMV
jgi:hypothetical protein